MNDDILWILAFLLLASNAFWFGAWRAERIRRRIYQGTWPVAVADEAKPLACRICGANDWSPTWYVNEKAYICGKCKCIQDRIEA